MPGAEGEADGGDAPEGDGEEEAEGDGDALDAPAALESGAAADTAGAAGADDAQLQQQLRRLDAQFAQRESLEEALKAERSEVLWRAVERVVPDIRARAEQGCGLWARSWHICAGTAW